MFDRLFWIGRLGMLALMFLFLVRLAVILARPEGLPRKDKPAVEPVREPAPKQTQPPPSGLTLRLLQGETRVWLKENKGEVPLEPGGMVVAQGLLTLGRAPGNDLRLEDPFASAYHARLRMVRQDLVIEDLGTTNGTRVNGVRINGPVRIEPGDIIDVGSTSFTIEE